MSFVREWISTGHLNVRSISNPYFYLCDNTRYRGDIMTHISLLAHIAHLWRESSHIEVSGSELPLVRTP